MARLKTKTIELRNLAIGYVGKKKTKTVARDITGTLFSGELTCLIGSNGIGKSTLLRTLSAFQPKLGGEVLIFGKEVSKYSDKALSRLISVVLTERPSLYNTTLRELVEMGRSPYTGFWGSLMPEDRAKVDEAIDMVRIRQLEHRLLHSLSDGEKQKGMIAKALAQDTPVIFLDEPTAFLDFPSKVEIMQLLHRLSRETGKTIFLSTHDLELALQIADKIWLFDQEPRLHIGTPEDLALQGVFTDFFSHKGIVFDQRSGLFRIENGYDRTIRFTGRHTVAYSLVSKALLRYRIYASFRIESEDEIEIDGGKIILRLKGREEACFDTIEALIEALDHE